MFERFTEKSRRVIFFARFECSALGSTGIGPEHLMLGLLRESQNAITDFLKVDRFDFAERLKRLIPTNHRPVSTSVDLPLNDAGRRVIAHAAEEAQRLSHSSIGIEHLLLGILREDQGPVAEALRAAGAPTLAETRAAIVQSIARSTAGETPARFAPSIYLVDESTGKPLSVRLSPQSLPRIGELLSFALSNEPATRYRVIDVEWDLETPSGNIKPSLHAIYIKLRAENASAS